MLQVSGLLLPEEEVESKVELTETQPRYVSARAPGRTTRVAAEAMRTAERREKDMLDVDEGTNVSLKYVVEVADGTREAENVAMDGSSYSVSVVKNVDW